MATPQHYIGLAPDGKTYVVSNSVGALQLKGCTGIAPVHDGSVTLASVQTLQKHGFEFELNTTLPTQPTQPTLDGLTLPPEAFDV